MIDHNPTLNFREPLFYPLNYRALCKFQEGCLICLLGGSGSSHLFLKIAILFDMEGGRNATFPREYFSDKIFCEYKTCLGILFTIQNTLCASLIKLGNTIIDDHVHLLLHKIPVISSLNHQILLQATFLQIGIRSEIISKYRYQHFESSWWGFREFFERIIIQIRIITTILKLLRVLHKLWITYDKIMNWQHYQYGSDKKGCAIQTN